MPNVSQGDGRSGALLTEMSDFPMGKKGFQKEVRKHEGSVGAPAS